VKKFAHDSRMREKKMMKSADYKQGESNL